MAGLGWILRILAVILVIRLLMRFVGGLMEGLNGGAAPRGGSRSAPKQRVGGRLVKDPQCGMHIPETNAVRLGSGEHAVYFCSTTCRDKWSMSH